MKRRDFLLSSAAAALVPSLPLKRISQEGFTNLTFTNVGTIEFNNPEMVLQMMDVSTKPATIEFRVIKLGE